MRRILIWTEADIAGLADTWGLARVLTELDHNGFVTRELGFDAEGNVVHRHPGEPTKAEYGIFDLSKIAASDCCDMSPEEFERLWSG